MKSVDYNAHLKLITDIYSSWWSVGMIVLMFHFLDEEIDEDHISL